MSTERDDIAIDLIKLNGGTQPRGGLDEKHVDELAADMDAGDELPPIQVVFDGEHYWPWDGFHRIAAAKRLDHGHITAEVRQGTRRDAVLLSVGANAEHNALRRTNADKRRAVMTLLNDEEWSKNSNRWIADKAKVDESTVRNWKNSTSAELPQIAEPAERTVRRGSSEYTMNTAGINAGRAAVEKPADDVGNVDPETGEILDGPVRSTPAPKAKPVGTMLVSRDPAAIAGAVYQVLGDPGVSQLAAELGKMTGGTQANTRLTTSASTALAAADAVVELVARPPLHVSFIELRKIAAEARDAVASITPEPSPDALEPGERAVGEDAIQHMVDAVDSMTAYSRQIPFAFNIAEFRAKVATLQQAVDVLQGKAEIDE